MENMHGIQQSKHVMALQTSTENVCAIAFSWKVSGKESDAEHW
jgi:hypothetical protein